MFYSGINSGYAAPRAERSGVSLFVMIVFLLHWPNLVALVMMYASMCVGYFRYP